MLTLKNAAARHAGVLNNGFHNAFSYSGVLGHDVGRGGQGTAHSGCGGNHRETRWVVPPLPLAALSYGSSVEATLTAPAGRVHAQAHGAAGKLGRHRSPWRPCPGLLLRLRADLLGSGRRPSCARDGAPRTMSGGGAQILDVELVQEPRKTTSTGISFMGVPTRSMYSRARSAATLSFFVLEVVREERRGSAEYPDRGWCPR